MDRRCWSIVVFSIRTSISTTLAAFHVTKALIHSFIHQKIHTHSKLFLKLVKKIFYLMNFSHIAGQGCSRNPCGSGAVCQETLGGRPVCSCPPGSSGNPLTYCRRGECSDHVECRLDQACQNGHCVNACIGQCGIGANCEVRNHVPVCSCPARYKGDPFHHCRRMDPCELNGVVRVDTP